MLNYPKKRKSFNRQISSGSDAPQRTCIACRTVKAKRELIRLVRTPEGSVEVDPSGKKSGRGVYLCRTMKCWETGLKGGRIGHALRTTVKDNDREQLLKYSETIDKE